MTVPIAWVALPGLGGTCVNVTFVLCCLDCTASPAHRAVMEEPQLDDVQVEQSLPIAAANAARDEACNCIGSGVKTHADASREPTGADRAPSLGNNP